MSIKAIQTKYKGYRFRSRLEARWAVFFDAIRLEWQYEPEGFELSSGEWYLPDFWIPLPNHEPGAGYWTEIKGTDPTENEKEKARQLAWQSGHNTIILVGSPWPGEVHYWKFLRPYPRYSTPPEGRIFSDDPTFSCKAWSTPEKPELYISYPCGAALIAYEDDRYVEADWMKAAKTARSARFEHGEVPNAY